MRPRLRAAGFTLLETIVAVSVFVVVGYSLFGAVGMGHRSQSLVMQGAESNRQLRASRTVLMDELSTSSDANIVVVTLPDGNHQVDFMLPIEVAGNPTWGVSDRVLGTNENWRVRYTVQTIGAGQGLNRQLVRQVIDATGNVMDSDVVAEGLADGQQFPRGFSMVQTGDVWDISITTAGHAAAAHGEEVDFHVRTRN